MSNYLNTVKEPRFSASARAIVEAVSTTNKVKPTSITELATLWINRFKQRRSIGNLPDHLLRDVGVSRSDALKEACKPFWQK